MTELQMIRHMIPIQYKRAQEATFEYKRSQNPNQIEKREKALKELYRLIECELNMSCKFNSRQGTGRVAA